jgi:hypothetical protein
MPKFVLRRSDYGATLRDTSISAGTFQLRSSTDVTITVGTPATTDDTQANTTNTGDGKAELVK